MTAVMKRTLCVGVREDKLKESRQRESRHATGKSVEEERDR